MAIQAGDPSDCMHIRRMFLFLLLLWYSLLKTASFMHASRLWYAGFLKPGINNYHLRMIGTS